MRKVGEKKRQKDDGQENLTKDRKKTLIFKRINIQTITKMLENKKRITNRARRADKSSRR